MHKANYEIKLSLLGAPLLQDSMQNILNDKLEDLTRMVENLVAIDSHDALYLPRNCFSIPKLTYFLRSAPCYKSGILKEYDHEIRNALERILNIQITNSIWEQSSLPIKDGRLGIRPAEKISLPAFLSSTPSCEYLSNQILPLAVATCDYED